MWNQIYIICLLLVSVVFLNTVSEKVPFINVEHPRVTYINPKFIKFANFTTTRYGRANPIYFVGLHFESTVTLDNTTIVDFYFYELLTNVYKISFIHIHYNVCDLLSKENFFAQALRQGELKKPCPHPPGIYHLVNMTFSLQIPRGFPISNGRIYANFSDAKTKVWYAEGYIDMKLTKIDTKHITH